MNIEISVAIIGAASVVISAYISTMISKHTTRAEIEAAKNRQDSIWKHERETAIDLELSNTLTEVSEYLRLRTGTSYRSAISAMNILRPKVCGTIAVILDDLYYSIESHGNKVLVDEEAVKQDLARIVEERRKQASR